MFHICKGGEIITTGASIFSERTSALFQPLDSECPPSENGWSVCCRLPEWIGVPIEQEVPLPPPIPTECLEGYEKPDIEDDYSYDDSYEDSYEYGSYEIGGGVDTIG